MPCIVLCCALGNSYCMQQDACKTRWPVGLTGSSLLHSCLGTVGAQRGGAYAYPGKAAPRK